MADAFRGLTIRLGADARPLQSAISSITSSARAAQSQLNKMNKALRFDKGNLAAMRSAIDLIGDKATHSARAVNKIETAMKQAASETIKFSERSGLGSQKLAKMAESTTKVYAATEKIRSEYNHVDTELQHIYDSMKQAMVASRKWADIDSFSKADKAVNALRRNLSGIPAKSDEAKEKLTELLRIATRTTDVASMFGINTDFFTAPAKMVEVWKKLRAEQKALNADLESMNKVEGFRAMRTQLIAFEAELKQAATEAVRLKSELYATGSAKGLSEALSYTRRLDDALESSTAEARQMSEAFRALPASIEVARAKILSARNAQDALIEKIRSLKSVVSSIEASGFDKLEASAKNVYVEFERASNAAVELGVDVSKAEARLEKLNQELKEADTVGPFNHVRRSVQEIKADIEKTTAQLSKLKAKADAADTALEKAAQAKTWKESRAELVRYEAELERVRGSMSRLNAMSGMGNTLREFGYGLYSTVTPAIMIAGRYAIQAANDIDSAYRDMRKTVNGTEEEFEHLKDAAMEFSQTHITAADTILEIEAMGGQLGIAAGNLEGFAEVVSNLDIATDIESEDLAKYIGQLSNIMDDISVHKDDPIAYQKAITSFSDSLVRLGNNSAAQESSIMKVMMRIASLGNISGMTTPQLLAISTAIAATGQGCEAAGTAISKTFSNIEAAVGKGGAKLEGFASVAGMSAEEFAHSWETKPVEAFTSFIEGLKRIDEEGGSVDNTLASLGINSVRQKQALEGLTNTLDVLHDSLGMSQDAWDGLSTVMGDGSVEKAGDAAREAQRKSEGFSGAIGIMTNNAKVLADELSTGALPIINMLSSAFQGLTNIVKGMPGGLKTVAVAFAGVLALSGPMGVASGTMVNFVKNIRDVGQRIGQTSMLIRATKETWSDYAKTVDRASAASGSMVLSSKKVQAAQQNVVQSLEKVREAQRRHVANLGTESTALAQREQELMRAQTTFAQYGNAMSRVAGVVKGALAGIGATAAITVGITLIEELATAISEAQEKAATFDKATSGVGDLSERLGSMSSNASKSLDDLSASLGFAAKSGADYRQAAYEAAQATADFVDAANEKLDNMETNAAMADYWGRKLAELTSNFDGTEASLSELKVAASQYSQVTGENVSVVDEFTGRLSMNTDELEKNTEAFKKNAYAKALGDVAQDSLKEAAAIDVERARQVARLSDLYEQQAEAIRRVGEEGYYSDSSFDQLRGDITDLEASTKTLSDQSKELHDFADAALDLAAAADKDAEAFDKSSEAAKEAARSAETYISALGASGGMFAEIAAEAGYGEESLDDFAAALHDAGISADVMASVGVDAFRTLYSEANGNLTAVKDAMNLVNDFNIDPKHIIITDDGTVKLNMDLITDLEEQSISDKGFMVTDDGTIDWEIGAIGELNSAIDSVPSTHTTWFDGDTSLLEAAVSSARSLVRDLTSKATAYIDAAQQARGGLFLGTSIMRNARGGIFAIPRHASGSINGIVTRPTMTNVGLTGEAGAEAILHMRHAGGAIIPLSNRRYVRPFAQAVAAEIPQGNQGPTTIINIGDVSYSENSREGQAVLELTRVLGMEV